jgi:hypothetical protein
VFLVLQKVVGETVRVVHDEPQRGSFFEGIRGSILRLQSDEDRGVLGLVLTQVEIPLSGFRTLIGVSTDAAAPAGGNSAQETDSEPETPKEASRHA